MNDTAWVIDLNGNFIDVNDAAVEVLGYSREEYLSMRPQDIDTNLDPEEISGLVKRMATDKLQVFETIHTSKDGKKIPVEIKSTLMTYKGQQAILSIARDITERKRAEETILQINKAVDSSRDAIGMSDAQGHHFYHNKAFTELFEYTPEELEAAGGGPVAYVNKNVARQVFDTIMSGGSWDGEVQMVSKSGRKFPVLLRADAIKYQSGKVIGLIGVHTDITERKQSEEKLRESEKRFRGIVEGTQAGYFFIDRDGRFQKVNDAWLQMHKYTSPDEIIGQHFSLTQAETDLNQAQRNVEKLLHGKPIPSGEFTRRCKDGSIGYHTFSANPVVREGKVIGLEGFLIDITDRKQAEEALRESAEKYRAITTTAMDGFTEIDGDGRFIYVNDASCRIPGYSRDEHRTMSITDIDAAQTPEKTKKALEMVKKIGSDRFEAHIRRKDGRIVDIEASRTYIPKTDHFLIFHRDITERKRAEEALKESEEKFRNLAEQSPNMIYISRKNRIVYANKRCTEITGYTRNEFYAPDFDFMTLIAPKSKDIVKKQYPKHLQGEIIAPYEYTLITKAGRKIEAINATRLIQYGGESALLGVITDITERKKVEEELRRNYQQMQEMMISTVNALAATVEMKDQYTAGHQPRVTELACAIAEEMGLSEQQIEGIRMAGLIHDIGKIMVPAEILSKPGPLTELQFDMVKMHPQAGYNILKGIVFPWPVAEIVLQHQERMDGSGYPQGLSGDEIILEARILAVANIVEAMTSHRPYRPARHIKDALAEISQNKGVLYDPDVVDACLKLFSEKRFTFEQVR